jgi:superfamily I DNA and/or RNA helicase
VASNLFKGMNGYFDIVMFDEASQLRLEDNLPAILKGKQIIIAGDEHQMPPSNYFSKVFDGAVEDEDDIEEENEIVVDKDNNLLSCESLLDFGSELNFQKKHLDFHYRSRHPFLIDFSNYAFYNQRLKPLPNNFDYVPIKYVQVNGTFSDYSFCNYEYQILPESQKAIIAGEIRNYCHECGTRIRKSNWKFCPNCGAEL